MLQVARFLKVHGEKLMRRIPFVVVFGRLEDLASYDIQSTAASGGGGGGPSIVLLSFLQRNGGSLHHFQ